MIGSELESSYRTLQAQTRPSWREAVGVFLLAKVSNPNTQRAYRRYLSEAFERIGRDALADVTGADLAGYRAALLADGKAPSSHALALTAVRSFLKWSRKPHVGACQLAADVIEDALELPKATVVRPYEVLTAEEIRRVFEAARTPRDRALLSVMVAAGLRVSEAVGLDVGDIREFPDGGGSILVRQGKGNKDREVPAESAVLAEIKAYLDATGRTLAGDGPLFRAHDRGAAKRAKMRDRRRISARAAGNLVADIVQRAGIEGKRISPHSLRHSFAVQFYSSTKDVLMLQEILGHASVGTTQRYARHFQFRELLAKMPRIVPENVSVLVVEHESKAASQA